MRTVQVYPHEFPCICEGKGWRPGVKSSDWPGRCARCGGKGRITVCLLAKLIGERRQTIYRVRDGHVGPVVGERVFRKLAQFFPEALT